MILGSLYVQSCDGLRILTVRSCDELGILTVRSCNDLGIFVRVIVQWIRNLDRPIVSYSWDAIFRLSPRQSLLPIGSSNLQTQSSVFLCDILFFQLDRPVFRVRLSFRFQTTTVSFWLLLTLPGGVSLLYTMLFVERVIYIGSTSQVIMIS